MLDILVERDLLREFVHISVDHDADISALLCLLEDFLVTAFSAPHDRCQKLNPASLRQFHDPVDHLIDGLPLDHTAAVRTMRDADSRVKKTQVIVNLRHSSDRGPRIPVRRFLVDGNGGRKTFDTLHIRLLHLTEELAGIRRQRLHIASLSFCINRIKCQ